MKHTAVNTEFHPVVISTNSKLTYNKTDKTGLLKKFEEVTLRK